MHWLVVMRVMHKTISMYYWATLVIVVVMPVDILCPPKVMQLFYGWQLNLWLLLFLWLRMCWTAFIRIPEPMKRVGAA